MMTQYEKDEIIRYLIEKTPLKLDMRTKDLRYDKRSIYYKTYAYIKELQDEIKLLKSGDKE